MVSPVVNNIPNTRMTPEQFIYWLQGWLEIANPTIIEEHQLKIIQRHIGYVFQQGHLPAPTISGHSIVYTPAVAAAMQTTEPTAMTC